MRKDAFTFVEVLVSLAISALLIGTICSALIQVMQVERRTRVLREASFQLQSLACRTYLGVDVQDEPANWSLQREEKTIKTEQGEEIPWLIWQLAPVDDLSFTYLLGLRDGMGTW